MSPADRPLRLLVIEDEAADLHLLEETLKEVSAPYLLKHAATASEGLRHLEALGPDEGLPDAILLDLNLPGMDGRRMLAQIRATPRLAGLPVVVVTASPTDEDVLTAFDLRADGYLRKPVGPSDLDALLKRIAERVRPPAADASSTQATSSHGEGEGDR